MGRKRKRSSLSSSKTASPHSISIASQTAATSRRVNKSSQTNGKTAGAKNSGKADLVKSPSITPKKKAKSKKAKKEGKSSEDSISLDNDVLRSIGRKLANSSPIGLNIFAQLNKFCRSLVDSEEQHKKKEVCVVDVKNVAIRSNPLLPKYYDCESKSAPTAFHSDVRRAVAILEGLAACAENTTQKIDGMTIRSLGWLYNYADSEIRRCPPLLQKRIMKLLRHHFKGTTSFVYAKSFLRPSRFVKTFSNRLEHVTHLDLGDMKALKAVGLQAGIFPFLENLREFTWHRAEAWFVQALPSPHKLTSLSITLRQGQIDAETLSVLLNFQGLTRIYTGLPVPDKPTRFDLDVLLRSYQAFWNQRQYIPEQMMTEKGVEPVPLIDENDSADFALRAFPCLEHAAFWNAPEYLFAIMAKRDIGFETLQFGQLSQDLTRLCSIDSLMQALFKFNQPKYEVYQLSIKHLKLFLHAMPVVSLDYYLPQLMNGLEECLSSIRSLDLFVHCSFSSSMPSSWSLERGRPRKIEPKLENLTDFSLHIDGYCSLDDLDTFLPDCLTNVSLSFVVPREKKKAFLSSLLRFVQHLGDVNRFPDLEQLHVQVWGIRCFEPLLNKIVDCISGLRKLSVLCMPVTENCDSLKSLIGAAANKFSKLSEFALCQDLVKLLVENESVDKKNAFWPRVNWHQQLSQLRVSCQLEHELCQLAVGSLPRRDGWNQYDQQPEYPLVSANPEGENSEEEEEECEDESLEDSDDNTNDEEEDSMSDLIREDVLETESEDELDILERELEKESRRRDNRWQRSRARVASECSEPSDLPSEDVIVFKKKGRDGEESESEIDEEEEEGEMNSFLDNEAVEASGSSSSEGETEPEGESVEGSDDEEMMMAAVEMVNARPRKPEIKKRKIIVSDSE